MDFKLTRDMIESMFRMSEGRISPITGNAAHAVERHSGITNVNLQKRQGRHNQIELFTAFQDFAQAVDVAEIIFNHASVTPRRLYYKGKQGKGGRSDDSGQEVITHDIVKPATVRYQNAGGTLPTSLFTLVLHKYVGLPCNFMIYTFFPTLPV